MANYYTYGMVPDVDETVYGTSVNYAGLGFPEFADRGLPEEEPVGPSPLSLAEDEPVPADRSLPEEPYYSEPSEEYNQPTTMPTRRDAVPNLFVEGFTPDAGFATGAGDYDAMQKVMASLSLMDPAALKGLSGTSFADPNVAANAQFRADTRAGIGGGGSIYEEGALEAARAAATDPTKGIFSSGFEQLLAQDPESTRAAIEAKSARDLGALSKVEADYAVMKPLSDLLKANRFQEAFALAKETGSLDKLMDTNVLRELRPAFSQQEMRDFFAAVPSEYAGEKYDFKPDVGVLESMDPFGTGNLAESGYPDPTRAFKRKDDKTVETLAMVAAVAMLTAGLAPIVTGGAGTAGAGAAGGAGASGAGALTGVTPTGLVPGTTAAKLAGAAGSAGTTGGLGSALKAVGSIPAKIGGTIAETLGLPITSTVGKAALGNAVITGGTTAAKGGDLEDVLKAALLSAGVTYISAPVIDSLKDAAKAVGSKLGIATGAPATAAGTAVSDALSDVATDELLREVTVTATRPALSSLIGTAVGALPTSTKVDLPEPQIRTEAAPAETADDLAEVVVTSQRPDLTTLGGLATPTTTTPQSVAADRPVTEEPVEQPLDEVVVTSERPPLSDLLGLGAVNVPTTTPVEIQKPDYIEDVILPEEEPLEEVVVTSQRPPLSDLLGLGAVKVPTTTPVDVAKPDYIEDVVLPEEEPLEEVVVTGQRPPLSDLLGLGTIKVPTTTPVETPKPEYIEDVVLPEEEPLEEVVVTGTRPPLADLLGLGTVKVPTTTPVDLPQPEVILDQIVYPEEVVVEGTKPTDGGLTLPPFTIPLQTPVEGITEPKVNQPNPLKDLLDKYGSLENLLKLLGALGSAASGTKGATAPTAPTGGMGGALPKYTYTRQQLSPDIDYYTYGTRPEAKFFDYGVQLEKPTQPEGPPAKPPGDEPVMAKGGLMGYADGGSSETRYFDGPGSGRDDKIPALLSDGEYVMDAETLALLGDGSTKEGARRMDQFRANIRKHKGRALSRGQISPDAKSPDKYMGGGLA